MFGSAAEMSDVVPGTKWVYSNFISAQLLASICRISTIKSSPHLRMWYMECAETYKRLEWFCSFQRFAGLTLMISCSSAETLDIKDLRQWVNVLEVQKEFTKISMTLPWATKHGNRSSSIVLSSHLQYKALQAPLLISPRWSLLSTPKKHVALTHVSSRTWRSTHTCLYLSPHLQLKL